MPQRISIEGSTEDLLRALASISNLIYVDRDSLVVTPMQIAEDVASELAKRRDSPGGLTNIRSAADVVLDALDKIDDITGDRSCPADVANDLHEHLEIIRVAASAFQSAGMAAVAHAAIAGSQHAADTTAELIAEPNNVRPLFIDKAAPRTGWPPGYAPATDYDADIGAPRCAWERDGHLGPTRHETMNGARIDAWRDHCEDQP